MAWLRHGVGIVTVGHVRNELTTPRVAGHEGLIKAVSVEFDGRVEHGQRTSYKEIDVVRRQCSCACFTR